jgi:hypothetical protein
MIGHGFEAQLGHRVFVTKPHHQWLRASSQISNPLVSRAYHQRRSANFHLVPKIERMEFCLHVPYTTPWLDA